jgi:hypothetical protein
MGSWRPQTIPWQPISTAPFDCNLELAVFDTRGRPHALVFPCRRILGPPKGYSSDCFNLSGPHPLSLARLEAREVVKRRANATNFLSELNREMGRDDCQSRSGARLRGDVDDVSHRLRIGLAFWIAVRLC